MKILAVEFSSEERSVAVVGKNSPATFQLLGSASESGGRDTHAFELIERALVESKIEREEIGCIAIGIGPGSYTGIRAAIALGQGWQLAREINLLGISSVECLAAQAFANGVRGKLNLIVDAQRNEFYLAAYEIDETGCSEREPLHLVTFSAVEKRIIAGETVLGPQATRFFTGAQDLSPSATTLGQLACEKADCVSGEKLEPIYLREVSFVKATPPRFNSNGI